jgi:hypothetical protein
VRYRGAVESIDGSPGLVLGPAWRRGCGLEAGDRVSVELEQEAVFNAALESFLQSLVNPERRRGE